MKISPVERESVYRPVPANRRTIVLKTAMPSYAVASDSPKEPRTAL